MNCVLFQMSWVCVKNKSITNKGGSNAVDAQNFLVLCSPSSLPFCNSLVIEEQTGAFELRGSVTQTSKKELRDILR